MTFLLGLLLPICYIPGITGAAINTQWALLSLVLPGLLWSRASPSTCLHYFGWGFLAYAFLGLAWALQPLYTIYGLWLVVLWALSFQFGFTCRDPRPLLCGFAVGLAINVVVAGAQAFGFTGIPYSSTFPAGLLYNSTVLSAASALCILFLCQYRLWAYIPAPALAMALSHSRGGWVALALGLASRAHWTVPVAALALAGLFLGTSGSDSERLEIWGMAIHGFNFLGWSAGSFATVFFPQKALPSLIHPGFIHNDYLQLWFEFGIASVIPFTILGSAFLWRPSPALWGFAILGLYYFPLYTPLTAFLGCFAVGHSLRGFSTDGLILRRCRPDLLPRSAREEPSFGFPWEENLPVQLRSKGHGIVQ